jgi:hypothetical protein
MAIGGRQANFTLPIDPLREFRRLVPWGEQSRVVREALGSELKRIKFQKALRLSFGAWLGSAHLELAKGSRAYVRSLRKSGRPRRVRTR